MSVFTSQDEHRIEIDLNAASNSSTTGGAEGARTTTATPPASDPNDLEAQQAPTGATGVFARGVAAAYAVYTNVRKRVAKRFKDRVMRFMRYELSNSRPTTNAPSTRENAQGRPVRAADVTYDSLVFKITFVLGFLLRFPIMWMVGSFLFIGTANFKKSTIKVTTGTRAS
ncbi:uncharacterized protein BcabD6B2_42740 [Babesia caballi]|uniref:Conserved Plasmodium protein homolog n=1 Tax=Babesia caballi TaxID=5871 RepID=A0AAV4LXN6_BABCB|nr:conserved Plasmodium protein homolog [Babesia caballi]